MKYYNKALSLLVFLVPSLMMSFYMKIKTDADVQLEQQTKFLVAKRISCA